MRRRGPTLRDGERLPPDDTAPDAPFEDDTDEAPPEAAAVRIARLQREIAAHGREWKGLVRGSGSPPPRAFQLQELMSVKQAMVEELEPEVEVQVTRPTRGTSYVVGEREFRPGHHRVKASVAEMLRWMMDQDRIAELRRMHTLAEQRALDPYGLEGILDPGVEIDKPLGTLQG